jgi:alkyl hydroperoxide reductase subunit AhpF
VNLTLIISDNCEACERAIKSINKIKLNNPNITANVVERSSYDNLKIQIIPALFINEELFSYGDVDEEKLLKKID